MRKALLLMLLLPCFLFGEEGKERTIPEVLIPALLKGEGLKGTFLFSDIVKSSTGHEILPLDKKDPVDAATLALISSTMGTLLAEMNRPDNPTAGLRRINEASRFFENKMLEHMNAADGFTCNIPVTSEGRPQRSGYPDLKLVHEASGRVTYIDPKLFETGSKSSSLRTFYFEPKVRTGKIHDDAHHILIGIEHDGNDGKWKFLHWHAVDLAKFRVRLKAEFQAANKDLYTPELMVGSSDKTKNPSQ